MGSCGSCLRLVLDAESDVKIHVIEPTSIAVPEQSIVQSSPQRPQPSGPTLQVPSAHKRTNSAH